MATQKVPLEGGERTKGKVVYTHPTAIINAPKLLEPAVLTEEPGRWYGVDDHIEERVHQEGLEVHPGRLGMLRGMSKKGQPPFSHCARDKGGVEGTKGEVVDKGDRPLSVLHVQPVRLVEELAKAWTV